MPTISAIILTYNEELHIARCINSLKGVADAVYVIDSFSNDRTTEIAKELGAKVFQNPWKNYATQFNWALQNCLIDTDWVWRVDADEYIDAELGNNVKNAVNTVGDEVTGIYVKRKIVFLGRPLLHGTWYPRWYLKVFRFGVGECENRWMDEHIKLTHGQTIQVEGNQIDDNLNDLTWWTEKHNGYATREMVDMLCTQYGLGSTKEVSAQLTGEDDQKLRWLKQKYVNMPLFVRPFINFIYRYIFRFGFLDGKEGLMWHFLQGFWYRFLVDAKIWELKRRFGGDREKIVEFLKEKFDS